MVAASSFRAETSLSSSRIRILALSLFALSAFSTAQTKGTVSFGGLKNLELVNEFYDGGMGSLGSGPGPNYGLQFTATAQAIVSASQGGSGNFVNNPGRYPVMFFQTGQNVTVTATSGIETALWFYYSAIQPGAATVYSGANGTGTILASVMLTPNNSGCTTYKLCVWTPVGVPLSAPAGSIVFSGTADYLAIGTIHMGFPLPTAMSLASSLNPSVQGEPVTFTATVSATGTAPVGSVTFRANGKVIGVVPVVSGVASITVSSLKTGSVNITAQFAGAGFTTIAKSLSQVVN